MALTEETLNDKIEIVNNGSYPVIQVRTANIIKKDGAEISRSFHRHIVVPTADLTNEDPDVMALGNVVFTQDHKDAYLAEEQANAQQEVDEGELL